MSIVHSKVSPDDTKGKTWGPSTLHQRERGYLPALKSTARSQNIVKSAPNLDKSRSSASTRGSQSDVQLGKSEDGLDKMLLENDRFEHINCNNNSFNNHSNNSNTFYHLHNNQKKHHNSSLQTDEDDTEHDFENGYDYDSDEVQIGCFGGSSYRNIGKSKKNKFLQTKIFQKSNSASENLPRNQLKIIEIPFDESSKSQKSNGTRERKIQFADNTDQNSILYDRTFYRKMQKSLDEIPCFVGQEDEFKNGKNNRKFFKISKSNDELSLCGEDHDFQGNQYWSSQFKREYFFTNIQNPSYQDEADAENSDSS